MPLLKGKKNVSQNIRELVHNGTRKRPMKQIIAIALHAAGALKSEGSSMAKKKKTAKKKKK